MDTAFWDALYANGTGGRYTSVSLPDMADPVLNAALSHFGDVRGRSIIDLGCGTGATSLFIARLGANVTSVDVSPVAISNLSDYCARNKIKNITPKLAAAHDIDQLGPVDFVFGSMILHHLEPFAEFSAVLRRAVKPEGKAFFWENNASSKLIIWFRQHVIGKLWIPKYGDKVEFPLMPSEVDELRKVFGVRVEYPELLYFQLISHYLLRGRLLSLFKRLDDYFYQFAWMRKRSYRQYIYLYD